VLLGDASGDVPRRLGLERGTSSCSSAASIVESDGKRALMSRCADCSCSGGLECVGEMNKSDGVKSLVRCLS
jgi:hypothetical protein